MNTSLPGQVRALTLSVHRDIAKLTPGVSKSNDFGRDRKWLSELPLETALQELPRVGKALDASLASGASLPSSLALLARVDNPASPIPDRFMRYWWEGYQKSDIGSVTALRQLLLLFSKLDLGTVDPEKRELAIASFDSRNAALPLRVNPPGWLVHNAQVLARWVLSRLDLTDIKPRHGRGAVAGGEKPWEKMDFKKIYLDSQEFYPVDEYFFLDVHHLSDSLADLQSWEELPKSEARLAVVPKDFRGPRIISMEPKEKMWLQQGQARAMMDYLESARFTRGHVNFTDQSVNRRLALASSLSDEYVTLDLKDASDCVSTALVEAVLPNNVFRLLNATRSTITVLPGGQKVTMNMFAPMGSACCFPVESLIFWLICVSAVAHEERLDVRGLTAKSIERASRAIFVYGDDIIVRRPYHTAVGEALTLCGFVLNPNKCCVGHTFKESCGCDAFLGQEVTPIRIKHLPDVKNPESFASTCKYINMLTRRGYNSTADMLERMATDQFGPIPRSWRAEDDGYAIVVRYRSEALGWNLDHFRSRYNRGLQCLEFLTPSLAVQKRKRSCTSWSEFFRSMLIDCQEEGSLDYPVPHRIRLTKRWRSF